MDILEACDAIVRNEPDAIVVSTMGAMGALDQLGREQPRLSSVPLMGGAASLGLGLALAHPDKKVLVLDGDASLLMELGGLVTVAGARPENFHHFVIENGVQFSGMANLALPANGEFDLCAMATAAGYRSVGRYEELNVLQSSISELLASPGPTFSSLVVAAASPVYESGAPQIAFSDWHFSRMRIESRLLAERLSEKADGNSL